MGENVELIKEINDLRRENRSLKATQGRDEPGRGNSQELLRELAEPVQKMLFGHVYVDAEVLRQLLFGLALVVVMLYRPSGIWPAPKREDRPVTRAGRHTNRVEGRA